jgi:hypothetical protein
MFSAQPETQTGNVYRGMAIRRFNVLSSISATEWTHDDIEFVRDFLKANWDEICMGVPVVGQVPS